MSPTIVFAAGALFLVVLVTSLWRVAPRGGRAEWALAWCALYASGLVLRFSEAAPALRFVYPWFGVAFAALLFAGARGYTGARVPRWYWNAAVAVALIRGVLATAAPPLVTQIGAAALISAGALLAAHEIWRSASGRRAGPAERLLVFALPTLAVTASVYEWMQHSGVDPQFSFFLWLTSAVFVASIQIAAIFEQSAARLAEERATLAALVESVPLGLALVDSRGRLTRHNSVFASLAGIAGEDAKSLPEMRRVAEYLTDSAAERTALAREDLELSLRGGTRVVSLQRPVRGASGAEIGRLWVLRDVTIERRLEAELRLARQLETIGRLAGGVAHDFNNQLTVVLGNAALLESGFTAEDPRASQLKDIQLAAEHCAAITRDLLDFARQSPSQRGAVDLAELLREAVAQRRRHSAPDVEIRIAVEPGVPRAHADRAQLRRVIDNLLANAVEAVSGRGTVEVSVRVSQAMAGQLELAVSDDGPGMSGEVRERIFDPFFTTKRDSGGTGLGLAIVHGIVAAHGGAVHVETSPQGGARFVTTWPASFGGTEREPHGAGVTRPARSLSVLVVEDEPGVRRLVAAALRDAGHHVVEFETAEQAEGALSAGRGRIDIAIVDLSLPGMSGAEFVDELAKRRPELPALLVSGHFTPPESSAVPFLAKPFRAQELLAAVDALLAARRAN